MSERKLSNREFLLIARELEIYHAVFAKIWGIGKPRFNEEIPTACVAFNREGNYLDFQFNPEFWDKLSAYERLFIICHESLHVILNHGVRLKELIRELGNVAADVVINEMLVNSFGFDRSNVPWVDKNGCWLNTAFKELKVPVEEDRSMEYYYSLLKNNLTEQIKEAIKNGTLKIVDGHEGLDGANSDNIGDLLNDVLDSLNDKEKESFDKMLGESNPEEVKECNQQAGTMPGKLTKIVKVGFVKKKKKWETVIRTWATRCIKVKDKDQEQWVRVNRRFVGICSNLFLPSEMEVEERDDEKKKIKVVFFQDTSGSCSQYATRFFTAAKSLPTNRFDIDLYCFDTNVYKTTLASGKLYGFGGTSFDILENYVYTQIAKRDMSKYPKAIFVITDGFGNSIQPKLPKRWYWFLSENYRNYIPKECNIFNLKDFE